MADTTQSNNGFLYFLVGALLVAVIGFGIWYFAGQPAADNGDADLSISVSENGVAVDTPDN